MYWKSSGTMYTMNLRQASSWTCMHADLYMCVDACWQHAWLKVCMQKAGHPASSIVWIVSAFTCKEIDIHPVYPCMLWTMLYQASCRWRTLFHLGRPSLVTYYSNRLHQLRDISISFRPLVPNLLLPIKKDHLAHIYECRSSNWNCASAGFSDMMAALKELQKSGNINILYMYILRSWMHAYKKLCPGLLWPHEPRTNWTQGCMRDQGQIEPKADWGIHLHQRCACTWMTNSIIKQHKSHTDSHHHHHHHHQHQQQQQQQQGHVVAPLGQPIPEDSSRTWQV